jgi:hypothetical protein
MEDPAIWYTDKAEHDSEIFGLAFINRASRYGETFGKANSSDYLF